MLTWLGIMHTSANDDMSICSSRESKPGRIDGDDVSYH